MPPPTTAVNKMAMSKNLDRDERNTLGPFSGLRPVRRVDPRCGHDSTVARCPWCRRPMPSLWFARRGMSTTPPDVRKMSHTKQAIIVGLLRGKNQVEIAAQLGIGVVRVRKHVGELCTAFHVRPRHIVRLIAVLHRHLDK